MGQARAFVDGQSAVRDRRSRDRPRHEGTQQFHRRGRYTAAAEALAIGSRFGLDPARMLEIINLSTGRNFNTEVVMKEHLLDGKFATGFALV